jgi:predicted  nucleic acid-binding Zn-ribbon protein
MTFCCAPGHLRRHFVSAREKMERLEEYKAQLEQEIAGVEEQMKEFRSK